MVEVEEDRVDVLPQRPEDVVGRRQLAKVLALQQDGELDLPLVEDLVDVGRHLTQPVAFRRCLFHLVLRLRDADGTDLAAVPFVSSFCCRLVRILRQRNKKKPFL